MKHLLVFSLFLFSSVCFAQISENPFFKEWDTPPFSEIKNEHYLPAFEEGIKLHKAEIEKITENKENPDFKNTIEALEKSGELLIKVRRVFDNLNAANSNPEMEEIAKKSTVMISKHFDDIYLNEKLYKRIDSIYQKKADLPLTIEQKTVLENYHLDFTRGGANLSPEGKEELRIINEKLSSITLNYGENVRKENSKFELLIDKKEDLAGLPESMVQEASEKAAAKKNQGKWLFTIDKPTLLPFLQSSSMRTLREQMYKAYINRGNNNDNLDNKKLLSEIVSLRVKKAQLLGYKNYSEFVIKRKMAKTTDKVYELLNKIWKPSIARVNQEVADMQKIIDKEGGKFKLEPWDWWFYAEKVKKEKYDLDEEMIRPYFKLENVIDGAFALANKLYGIKFEERKDIQVYHSDVRVFEVKEADGKHIGILYTDYFPRDGKQSGAWCEIFRNQTNIDGKFVPPVLYNVGNFSKPTSEKPALLSKDEVETLFHEFGHALHTLFQNVHYPNATVVPADFAELPSQIMENWSFEPEVLKFYAKHYKTGEIIPDELVKKIKESKRFNQGFVTTEYIAASLLDLDLHSISDSKEIDVAVFEKESLAKMGLPSELSPRYMVTNFIHIAAWGYEAGYYSYLWSAVLDSDAFEAFKEKGLFDKELAESFRKNILEKAGSEDFESMYKAFRGREAKIDALLNKRGLN
ncbi:MAG: M3 family metallopeptidase [Candidatus Riflebacteria bacterium]|nr:M3 family metallopeptidase [Candidatus Riflebacteria bacterium]